MNLRLKLELAMGKPALAPQPAGLREPSQALLGQAPVAFAAGTLNSNLFDRDRLRSGNVIHGPALLLQLDTTIVVPPAWGGAVDPFGNLVLEPD